MSDETKMAEKVAEGRALDRLAVEQLLASDEEPSLEQKAAIIAAPEAYDYPTHWNDEVAEAYLGVLDEQETEGLRALEQLQDQFNRKLQEMTRERHNRLVLQVATPILAAMVGNLANARWADEVRLRADGMDVDNVPAVLINDALDLARGLLKGCEVSE